MQRLQDFFTIYKQAAWDKDADRMVAIYDENVLIFDMWTNGYQNGLTKWASDIKEWFGSLGEEKVIVIFEMIETHESGEMGLGSALITYQAISTDGEILRSMKNRITIGFQKKKDNWKVIHQHTSAPIDTDLVAILNFA